jgi:hypothetical protein
MLILLANTLDCNSKAIVWKDFKQAHVLEGHTAPVWAVLAVDDELILTGTIIYLFIFDENLWCIHICVYNSLCR